MTEDDDGQRMRYMSVFDDRHDQITLSAVVGNDFMSWLGCHFRIQSVNTTVKDQQGSPRVPMAIMRKPAWKVKTRR